MGLREEAIDRFARSTRMFAMEVQDTAVLGRPAYQAVRDAASRPTHGLNALASAFDAGLDIEASWHLNTVVATFAEDDLPLLVAIEDAETDVPTAAVYPVGACRRCEAAVPLGPEPSRSLDDLGSAIVAGIPVGHRCAGDAPGPG